MNGGAIITWVDGRNGNLDIYAQHVNSTGTTQWYNNGIVICNYAANQFAPQLVSDGSGGVIITWQDERPGASEDDIYAQRVNSTGTTLWGANGVSVCTTSFSQINPQLVSDGNGGAIIVWANSNAAIYAQRINADGDSLWTSNGVLIETTDFMQYIRNPQLASDGNGGAIISFEKDPGIGDYELYAQHIDSAGTLQWVMPSTICMSSSDKSGHHIVSDGNGGAIVSWQDTRAGDSNIYAERVDGSGVLRWIADGYTICGDADEQTNAQLISDGNGGAIIAWNDERGFYPAIYAQRVNAGGTRQWASNGIPVSLQSFGLKYPQIASDGNCGAIITWNGSSDVFARRVESTGILGWGFTVCSAANTQRMPQVASDGTGGAIIVWQDYRSSSNYDIYAQRVSNSPPAVNHPDDIITSTSGMSTIAWILTDDQGPGEYRVIATDTMGTRYTVIDWTSWTDSVSVEIPINRMTMGQFTYTIEYTDDQGVAGLSDSVLVTILPDPVTAILLVSMAIVIVVFVLGWWRLKRRIAKLEQTLGPPKKVAGNQRT
nr:hypothetical protein [Candidatus Sigynarchaeota archaeon]